MVSKKRRLLKIGILCLMPLLALLLCLNNTYAYYFDANDNLISNNLYDKNNNIASNKLISHENGNEFYNFNGYYISDYIQVEGNSYYSCNNWNSYYCWWYDTNKSPISVLPSNVTTAQAPNNARYLRLSSNDIEDLMLNKGNSVLSYEPFGIWYNSDQFEITNFGPLYKVLNGTIAKLYDFNSSELSDMLQATPIINETIVWNNNYDFKNSMIPNIRNAIINGSDALYNVSRPMVLLSLKTPLLIDNLSFYRMVSNEIRYVYLYFDDGSTESISISNASDVSTKFSIWYNESKKSLTYIAFDNEVNFDMVSVITQPGYSMVYSDAYNNGSIDGYKEGYDAGIKQSNPISYREGYNAGYDAGIQEDLESSGFRTLITTILSYPVNMVRESLNFEFMGIHVASIVLFIVSLGIVAFVIKRFKD